MYVLHVWMVCGRCQEIDPFLSSPWGVNLWELATKAVISHALKISHVESVCRCVHVCVWLTTNGVVVRHQVLSPVWGSNTCQMEHGGCIQRAFRKIVLYSLRYMLLPCVRTSYQMAGVAGFSSALWCVNAIYYKLVFISTILFSSTETILSAEMSLGHRFYFSYGSFCSSCNEASHFQRLPFGICQPLASEALPLPSLPPSCVSPSPRLSAWQYPFIKARLTGIHRIHGTCTYDTDFQIRLKGEAISYAFTFFFFLPVLYIVLCAWKRSWKL